MKKGNNVNQNRVNMTKQIIGRIVLYKSARVHIDIIKIHRYAIGWSTNRDCKKLISYLEMCPPFELFLNFIGTFKGHVNVSHPCFFTKCL